MYLKTLTVKGFKSFAQATTFEFQPGVTAIVGPNGSGKSNVVDALSWVMGEQGVKTLRGGKMDDVIFAGTAERGPLGRAEVTLTIDNSDGALPIDYTEVTIRRTLFRQGSSEYAINGEACRLRDVQDLLSDSGLGREMHVIVGQGRLDAVLRATPEERRGFVEEAAGILKHRRRKERTQRKLDAMEGNLTRLNDLAGELRRQLKPLGEQAEIARVAQGGAAVVRDAQARLYADDTVTLRLQHTRLEAEEQVLRDAQLHAERELEQQSQQLRDAEQAQHNDVRDDARRVTSGLESALTQLVNLEAHAAQRVAFFTEQRGTVEALPQLTKETLAESQLAHERVNTQLPAAQEASALADAVARSAQQHLEECDADAARVAKQHAESALTQQRLRGELGAAERVLQLRSEELLRRTTTCEALRAQAQQAAQTVTEIVADHAREAGVPAVDDAAYAQAREQQFAADSAVTEARAQLHEVQQERVGLEARVSALQLSLETNDGASAVLSNVDADVRGRVSDHVTITPGYEAAVAAALGAYADALLVTDFAVGEQTLHDAVLRDAGRVTVVWEHAASPVASSEPGHVLDLLGETHHAVATKFPAAVACATVVSAAPNVIALLAHSFVVPDLAAALPVAHWLRGVAPSGFWAVVTRAGEVLTAHGVTGGSPLAPSRIELQATVERETQRIAELEVRISATLARCAERELAAAAAALVTTDTFAQLRATDARRAEHARTEQRVMAHAESLRAELARAEAGRTETIALVDRARAAVLAAEEELHAALTSAAVPDDVEMKPDREEQRQELVRARDAAQAASGERRVELHTLREREEMLSAQYDTLRNRFAQEQAAAVTARERARAREVQLERAQLVRAVVPEMRQSCLRSVAAAQTVLRDTELAHREGLETVQRLRVAVDAGRQLVHTATARVHAVQLRGQEVQVQLGALTERVFTELGLTEEVLSAEYGPDIMVPLAAGEQLEASVTTASSAAAASSGSHTSQQGVVVSVPYVRAEQQRRLAAAKQQLRQLGRFNPLALEEFTALEQRHGFLVEQLSDLRETRSDLIRIIRDLDTKMESIFSDAFADTQRAFARVFPILFPGGSGALTLTDSDSMLTAGIEMTVRPAGKNVARMSLLSGGERSLAAISWLLAIFQARPSPFYIMDEVEAALDDANLGRLLRSFAELRESSQLIVITHQRRTMEIADALYGVSMRQDGVSAVVGQRIE